MYRYIEIYTPSQDGTHDITCYSIYTLYRLFCFLFLIFFFSVVFVLPFVLCRKFKWLFSQRYRLYRKFIRDNRRYIENYLVFKARRARAGDTIVHEIEAEEIDR